jgi:hypothetical protein
MEAVMASKPLLPSLSAALLLAATPAPALQDARVEVVFVQPEKFTDVGNSYSPTDRQREALLGRLKQHLEARAAARVAKDSRLAISITDVDMAGGFEPWRGPHAGNIRIVRNSYPPRIVLSYRLTGADGKLIGEGNRVLSDLAYMHSVEYRDDLLRYEKKLLDDWLEREFAQPGRS